MSKLAYVIAITLGVVMFTIGALAGHSKTAPRTAPANAGPEQTMPFPALVKAWHRPLQPFDQLF